MSQLQSWLKNRNYAWRYKLRICVPLLLVLIGIDWLSKFGVMKTMELGSTSPFIPHFLRLNYVINLGSAYGSNQANPALAISLAAIFTVFILLLFFFGNDRKWLIGLSFLAGGSVANLVGRAWSPQPGGVIDFFQWDFDFLGANNYIFNLADVFVIMGVVLIALLLLFELFKLFRRPPTKRNSKKAVDLVAEREKREAN